MIHFWMQGRLFSRFFNIILYKGIWWPRKSLIGSLESPIKLRAHDIGTCWPPLLDCYLTLWPFCHMSCFICCWNSSPLECQKLLINSSNEVFNFPLLYCLFTRSGGQWKQRIPWIQGLRFVYTKFHKLTIIAT